MLMYRGPFVAILLILSLVGVDGIPDLEFEPIKEDGNRELNNQPWKTRVDQLFNLSGSAEHTYHPHSSTDQPFHHGGRNQVGEINYWQYSNMNRLRQHQSSNHNSILTYKNHYVKNQTNDQTFFRNQLTGHQSFFQEYIPDENLHRQDVHFLDSIYKSIGEPKLMKIPSPSLQEIQDIFQSMEGNPGVVYPENGRLTIELKMLGKDLVKCFLWVPQSWVTIDKQKAIKGGDYLKLDLTAQLKEALLREEDDFTLLVNVSNGDKRQAFIDLRWLSFQDRTKRELRPSSWCRQEQDSCCLTSVSVNLTKIGWDFVLSPQVIEYTYCEGHCDPFRVPPRMFLPQSASLRWKIHQSGAYTLPAPCCSPREYAPIEILYFDHMGADGSVEVKVGTVDDVLATTCACG